jgi:hypothetical protein
MAERTIGVLPFSRTDLQPVRTTHVFLQDGAQEGIRLIEGTFGLDTAGEQAAQDLMKGKGFKIGEDGNLAVVRESTARTGNHNVIFDAQLSLAPNPGILERHNIIARPLDNMLVPGIITDGSTLTALDSLRTRLNGEFTSTLRTLRIQRPLTPIDY